MKKIFLIHLNKLFYLVTFNKVTIYNLLKKYIIITLHITNLFSNIYKYFIAEFNNFFRVIRHSNLHYE